MSTQISSDDSERMQRISKGLPSKAEKIRALHREGYQRGTIARFLDIRYQHVYNVLKRSGLLEPEKVEAGRPQWHWAKIGPAGRVTLPTAYLEALGLGEGDDLQLVLGDGEVRLVPRAAVVARVQEAVAKYVPEGISLVDELIAERRSEAAAEDQGE